MPHIFLSLGSNIEPKRQYIESAIQLLGAEFPKEFQTSGIYKTHAYGNKDQSYFLNACVSFYSNDTPFKMLEKIRVLEQQLGRKRVYEKWAPRKIDIDILLFGKQTIQHPDLIIPHYELFERDFFLVPLSDLDIGVVEEFTGKSIEGQLHKIPPNKRTNPVRISSSLLSAENE